MEKITYEVRYGDPDKVRYGNPGIKVIKELTLESALRIYNRIKGFAEKHGLTWTIALWDSDGWLTKSDTINPTGIIS